MPETVRKFNAHHDEKGQFSSAERFLDITEQALPGTAGLASLEYLVGGEPKQRVDDIPLSEIHTTQQFVDMAKVRGMLSKPPKEGSLPIIIELGGQKYLLDGHHRLAMAAVQGEPSLKARVIWGAPKGSDSKGNLIKKEDAPDQRLVWGEVYAPNRPDVDGEYMTAEDIKHLAHAFMRKLLQKSVDVQHNNQLVPGCTVVESFIARDGDTDFIPGSWVICCHVDDDATWAKIKSGELNGFSVEAEVTKVDSAVDVEIPDMVTGTTAEAAGHRHTFFVTYGPDGKFKGGTTDVVQGHQHKIIAGTVTEEAQGHRHRFSSVDGLRVTDAEGA